LYALSAAGGDKETFKALMDFCLDPDQDFVSACCFLMAEVEGFHGEMSLSIASPESEDERVSQYSEAILISGRAVVADVAEKMKEGPLADQDKALILQTLICQRQALIAMVCLSHGIPYRGKGADWAELERMQALYGDYPGLFGAAAFRLAAVSAAREMGISPQESAGLVAATYGERVINIFEEAESLTADTRREIERDTQVVKDLVGMGKLGKEIGLVLDAGCAGGERVTGSARHQLGREGIRIGKIIGVDWRPVAGHDPALDQILRADVADVRKLLPDERFDLALNLWSASEDPQQKTRHLEFHLGVALGLGIGGIYLIDIAPLVQVPRGVRSHWEAAKHFAEKNPGTPLGVKATLTEYRTGRATDESPDSLIDHPLELLHWLEKMGFKQLNTDGRTLKTQLEAIKDGNLSLLYEDRPVMKAAPWLTASGWLRMTLVLEKVREPEESRNPLLMRVLDDLKRRPVTKFE
jgi:hypothetical protein